MKRASSARRFAVRGRPRLVYVVVALYGIIAFVFLAGYLARYVHPKYAWWLQLAGIGLPFSAAAVSIFAIGFAIRDRGRRRLLHLALLLLVVVRFPPWRLFPAAGVAAPDDLRILTYNSPGTAVSADIRVPDAIAALVDEADPDLIAFQEVYWRYAFGRKTAAGRADVESLIMNTGYDDAPDSISRPMITHQPVLSRIGIATITSSRFQYDPDDEDDLEIVRAETVFEGRRFATYNVHLASYGSRKPWEEELSGRFDPRVWVAYMRRYRSAILRRSWEAEHVRAAIEEAAGPFLVTGDFNATPHNWSYRRIASGLRDAMADTGGGPGFTYHRRRPIARIDYILASDEFEFTSARVLNGNVSDHLALTATVRWR